MPRNAHDALAFARRQHQDGGREWRGLCLVFVRSCFGIGPVFPSAAAAWHGAQFRHRETDGNRVPRGVPYFWTGGSQGFGHVVLSAGGGMCWSNDINVSGGISLVSINEISMRWGQTPQGWSEDLNRVRVWHRPEPAVVDFSDIELAARHDPAAQGSAGIDRARSDVRRLERALSRKGYLDPRYVDGAYGTMTVDAMRRYQRDRGLEGNGKPTLQSVRSVGEGRFKVKV